MEHESSSLKKKNKKEKLELAKCDKQKVSVETQLNYFIVFLGLIEVQHITTRGQVSSMPKYDHQKKVHL